MTNDDPVGRIKAAILALPSERRPYSLRHAPDITSTSLGDLLTDLGPFILAETQRAETPDPDEFFDEVCKLIPWTKPDMPERREVLAELHRRLGNEQRGELPPMTLDRALEQLAYGDRGVIDRAALAHFIRCWHQPSGEILARALLGRARKLLGSAIGIDAEHAARTLAEIDAFLACAGAPAPVKLLDTASRTPPPVLIPLPGGHVFAGTWEDLRFYTMAACAAAHPWPLRDLRDAQRANPDPFTAIMVSKLEADVARAPGSGTAQPAAGEPVYPASPAAPTLQDAPPAWIPLLPRANAGRAWGNLTNEERQEVRALYPGWSEFKLDAARWEHR